MLRATIEICAADPFKGDVTSDSVQKVSVSIQKVCDQCDCLALRVFAELSPFSGRGRDFPIEELGPEIPNCPSFCPVNDPIFLYWVEVVPRETVRN
jgi:hypothetical protein